MNSNNKSKKRELIIIITAFVVVIAMILAGIIIYNTYLKEDENKSENVAGLISDGWDTGIENSGSGAGNILVPGYSAAEMNAGDTTLKLSIGNPKDNTCGFYATLMLKDGTILYESELLKPGYGLEEVPLSQTLEKGEYDAVVLYQCVTLDEEETYMNSAESAFKLYVN